MSNEVGEDFGFVSRDPSVLLRADIADDTNPSTSPARDDSVSATETEKEVEKQTGEEEVDKFRSPLEQEMKVNSPAVTDDGNLQQGELTSPSVSHRGSMASVGSNSKSSVTSSEGKKSKDKSKKDITEVVLPQTFQVKYLGRRDARGLWGIKHTRRPVDAMVAAAKSAAASTPGVVLPLVKLTVSREGVTITETKRVKKVTTSVQVAFHAIDSISYGVQDLVYTRVFSMIVVRESADLKGQHPFECHAFVCDSRAHARKLTYALAAAFDEYSRSVRNTSGGSLEGVGKRSRKFAIDLRTPEQIEKDLQMPQEADSEA